ncbi:MAG: hypothetical protein ACHQDY_09015 [Solirubrobacterales bacterium]
MSTIEESPAHTEEEREDEEQEFEEAEDWDQEPLARRPRRRLLTPLIALLFALLVGAGGFIAGVLVEKGEVPPASAASVGSGRFAGLLRSGAGAGSPFAGRSGAVGQVANISGSNLYVTELQGNTIKVAAAAAQITKQVSTSVKDIRPGDTVIVQGAHASEGSIQASTVQDSGSSGAGGAGSPGSGGGEPALFGR